MIRYGYNSTSVSLVERMLEEKDAMLEVLKFHLLKAQAKMKQQADGKRRDVLFEEGEMVYVKLRPCRQKSLVKQRNERLSPRFYGPYKVLAWIGPVAYRLELPSHTSIHLVFHVSQLRKAIGASIPASNIPAQLSKEMELIVELENILQVRQRLQGDTNVLEVLIQWKGLPEFEATWEDYDKLLHQFLEFHLEDKVQIFGGGSIARPPVCLTYSRCPKGPNRKE